MIKMKISRHITIDQDDWLWMVKTFGLGSISGVIQQQVKTLRAVFDGNIEEIELKRKIAVLEKEIDEKKKELSALKSSLKELEEKRKKEMEDKKDDELKKAELMVDSLRASGLLDNLGA